MSTFESISFADPTAVRLYLVYSLKQSSGRQGNGCLMVTREMGEKG